MRKTVKISGGRPALSKLTLLFGQVAFLNANSSSQRSLLALGNISEFIVPVSETAVCKSVGAAWQYVQEKADWVFGYMCYELKDKVCLQQNSQHPDPHKWPLLRFFQPEIVLEWFEGDAYLHYYSACTSLSMIEKVVACLGGSDHAPRQEQINFNQAVSENAYFEAISRIQQHIQCGDVYEINYCFPFDAVVQNLNAASLYNVLNERTEAPFSVFYQDESHAVMCGSPERYLRKRGNQLLAQPIKGTIRRGSTSDDKILIETLRNDPKERAENIMITDLVRNDLSKVASLESVRVAELCGVYTFKTVHQMISSICAQISDSKTGFDAIQATFPMGSMTGAPKLRAMQIIEETEVRRRGLYSGSFGYFEPNGDFDFNVIIRSLLYSKDSGHLSFQVGSAITSQSDPVKEYEECLLKAEALLKSTQFPSHVV